MANFPPVESARLASCHPYLQDLVIAVNAETPVCVVCGWRGEQAQNYAYDTGMSGVKWPNSAHNHLDKGKNPCSVAVDLAPIDRATGEILWRDTEGFKDIAARMEQKAGEMGYKLTHWPITYKAHNGNSVDDLPHHQLDESEYT